MRGRKEALSDWLRHGEGKRLVRFGLVGGTGVFVNEACAALGLTILFATVGPEAVREHLAVSFGVFVSIFTNFVLNDGWTWKDRPKNGFKHWFQRIGRYYMVASIGWLAQVLVAFSLHEWFLDWNLLVANLFGIGAGILVNYPVNNRWTFSDREPPSSAPEASTQLPE